MPRIDSVLDPPEIGLSRRTSETARRAEAMGLIEPQTDPASIRQLTAAIRRAGIATSAADVLANVERPSAAELADLLQTVIAALEASPAPEYEWKGLARVFPPEDLAELLNVSVSSLKRYQSGERATPDAVAARLHHVALIVGDLAGSYNDIGIRRWFRRKRTQLEGLPPAALLKDDWDPDEEGPRRVRDLARSLVELSGT